MKSQDPQQLSIFGVKYEYLLLISPPENVKEEIAQIKRKFNAYFKNKICDLKSIAHITLHNKGYELDNYAKLVNDSVNDIKAFPITIEGWGKFDNNKKNKHVIYLKIKEPHPIISLMKSLKSKSHVPHITIAKEVNSELLPAIGKFFENLNYTAEWECKDVTILRRPILERHLSYKEAYRVMLNR